MDCQHGQIHHNPTILDGLHRITHRHGTRTSVPSHGQMDENTIHLPVFPPIEFNHGQIMEQPTWHPDLLSRPHLYGATVSQTIANSCQSILDRSQKPVHSNPSHKIMQKCNSVVVESQQRNDRSPMDLSSTRADPLHRQLAGGLGGASQLTEGVREMGPKLHERTYQCERNDGSMEKHAILRETTDAQKLNASHGQHQLCQLLKQTGRNEIPLPPGPHCQNTAMVPGTRHSTPSSPHPRSVQCHQRPIEQTRTNSDHRMVHSPISDSTNNNNMGETANRPLCNKVQLQDSNLLLTNSRPTSSGNRRTISRLESHDRICIPPTSDSHTGTTENKTGTMHSVLSCSRMELQVLVSNTSQPASGQPAKDSTNKETPKTATKQSVPSKSKNVTSPRLETVKRYLKTQGFSSKATIRITKRCRKTTNKLYEAKWRIYTNWCHQQKIDPITISTQQLGDFFTHLHEDLHKGYSAILGYRAVINNTIKLCTLQDKCSNFHIESLMRSFKLEKPHQDNSIPKWNLNLVLNSLLKAPYEPMLKASMKHLTWKTAFLTSFATAARVSELTALSRKKVAHNRDWSTVTLTTKDSFVAKNQDIQLEPEPRSFTIPALYDFAGPDLPDRYLCPVRSLRYYIHKTDYFRSPSQKALFISHSKKVTKEITVNTVANWIKNVIKLAYHTSNTQELTLAKTSAHEVRALSASVAFQTNQSCANINKACYWRGHSTFTNYYLRDLAMEENYELHMPNVVAASKKVITKPKPQSHKSYK